MLNLSCNIPSDGNIFLDINPSYDILSALYKECDDTLRMCNGVLESNNYNSICFPPSIIKSSDLYKLADKADELATTILLTEQDGFSFDNNINSKQIRQTIRDCRTLFRASYCFTIRENVKHDSILSLIHDVNKVKHDVVVELKKDDNYVPEPEPSACIIQ
ncbi:MAG TPA: hypothetical protein VGP47_06540 [Parachlamydiaceae bacterium]|nr:hypothetical protein [Parachlamydiaceae bacterium]